MLSRQFNRNAWCITWLDRIISCIVTVSMLQSNLYFSISRRSYRHLTSGRASLISLDRQERPSKRGTTRGGYHLCHRSKYRGALASVGQCLNCEMPLHASFEHVVVVGPLVGLSSLLLHASPRSTLGDATYLIFDVHIDFRGSTQIQIWKRHEGDVQGDTRKCIRRYIRSLPRDRATLTL